MELLLDRGVVIGLAVAGAVLSTAASLLHARGRLGASGTRRLNYAGYETNIIPSDRTDYAYSVLIDKTGTQDSTPILNVIGMLPGSVISSPDPNSKAHFLLIVGYDYEPCFRPENLGE